MTPTPVSKAPTSTMKGLVGSGCLRMDAVLNASLMFCKAWSAFGFHICFINRVVSGLGKELNPCTLVVVEASVELGDSEELTLLLGLVP